MADGWDDLSAASHSSKPDLTNNPFSPLATDQKSDDDDSDEEEDDTDKNTPTSPKDSPPPRPGVTFGNTSVKTIPIGHNPSGRNPYSKERRGTTGRGAPTRSTGRGRGWTASRSTAPRQYTRFTLRFNVTPKDTSEEVLETWSLKLSMNSNMRTLLLWFIRGGQTQICPC